MAARSRGKSLAHHGRELLGGNLISELPDDILISVLSTLTMKEAVRTSLVSKRWRYVWSYIPILNFDSCHISHEISVAQKALEAELPRYKSLEPDKHTYLNWVDQVVSSHKAPTIDEFRVQCHLEEDSTRSIAKWVTFAMEKRVKRLDLDFAPKDGGIQMSLYPFPSSCFCNSLTSLELAGVDVTGHALENFLYNCQALEFLSINDSESLEELKVVGPSLNLKYLILCCCYGMKYLEISAPNLVYFNYYGPDVSVPFKSTPKLTEFSIGGDYVRDLTVNLMDHSGYLSRLEALTLNLLCDMEYVLQFPDFPEFTKLKKLNVLVDPLPAKNLFCLGPLIEACPLLHTFILKVNGNAHDEKRMKTRRRRHLATDYHLKIVEFVGFGRHAMNYELAVYLLDIAVSLEKIIIDPRQPSEIGSSEEFDSCKRIRAKAIQIGAYLKPGTDLVIF